MNNIHKQLKYRTFNWVAIASFLWLLIVAKLFSVQVMNRKEYQQRCNQQADIRQTIKPLRGTIYDRNRTALTLDTESYSLAAHPYLVENKLSVAKKFGAFFQRPIETYTRVLRSSKTFLWLERDLDRDQYKSFKEQCGEHHGIVVERKIQRQYPFGPIGGQLIGMTDPDNRGILGLELEYNTTLSGESGWKIVQKDGWGRLQDRPDLPYHESSDGHSIILTIDSEYQTILHEELQAACALADADKGMGILIDPNNGEVLAISNYPPFDPNHPDKFSLAAQRNSVITDVFEPGSVMKIATATAAIESKIIHPTDSVHCEPGFIRIAGHTISDPHSYETITFAEVIKKSSNIGTIHVAQELGKDLLLNYILRYGFGSKTGIQFPGEVAGIVQPIKDWTDLVLSQVAIGQGIACTAIQIAYAYAAIANGGLLLKPQIVQVIEDVNQNPIYQGQRKVIRRVASRQTMIIMRDLLRLTVASGTGARAEVHGMAIAGKTGTAQKVTESGYSKTDYIATFVGFFPVNDPRLLCAISIDNPKGEIHTGGQIAAPIVRDIFKRIVNQSDDLFFHEEVTPTVKTILTSREPQTQTPTQPALTTRSVAGPRLLSSAATVFRMPDLQNRTSGDAIRIASQMGLRIQMEGSGLVTRQTPTAGTIVSSGSECKIILEPGVTSIE